MKILVTEDSAVYRHLLCAKLSEWDYSVESVPDAESALAIICASKTSLVLLVDWELPGMSGLELISTVRGLNLPHYVYAVVVTSRDDKGDVVLALNAGADDYVAKPFNEQELRARIQVAIRTLGVHERLIEVNGRLESLASLDSLTNLLNRRAFFESFQREQLRAQRLQTPITLVMCDLDHFKDVNDQFGHTVGDDVLQFVSRELKDACRGIDLVARMGGDEFLLALPGSTYDGGDILISRVLGRISNRTELRQVPISLSFGVSQIDLNDTARQAIEKVDARMYEAKRKRDGKRSEKVVTCSPLENTQTA